MKKFNSKDIVFLAILSVVLLLISSLIMPIVMFTQLTVLRQLFAAPIFALFSVIAIKKVPKIGTLSIVGLFTGGVLMFMSVTMLINNLLGAIIVEVLVLIFFRNYDKKSAIIFAASLYTPVTLPLSWVSIMVMKGKTLQEQLGSTTQNILLPLAVIALSIAGAFLGMKIANELKRTGKL